MVAHTQYKRHRKYFDFTPVKISLEKKLNSDLLPKLFIKLHLHKNSTPFKKKYP